MVDKTLPAVRYAGQVLAHLAHCDCACDCGTTPRHLPFPGEDTRLASVEASAVDLDAEWHAYFNPRGPVGVAALNTAARQVLRAFDQPALPAQAVPRLPDLPAEAVHRAIAELALVGLLQPADGPGSPPAGPQILAAWLHVTNTCNLACPYCYADKKHGSMALATGRQAVDGLLRTARQHGYTTLRLKYAGGEPTLRFDLVRELHAYARTQAADTGVALEEVLLTNGVAVGDEVLDLLAGEGMRLMVSLDGGPAAHNRLRGRGGNSTFEAVAGLLDRAVARGLCPDVSITLTSRNLDGVSAAVDAAVARSLPFNLNFYRECAEGRGGEALAPSVGHLAAAILDVFDLLRQRPAYPLPLGGILDRARLDVPRNHACAAGHDYLVVDVQGSVAPCQMILGTPWAHLSDADPLGVVRERGQDLFRTVEERPICSTCLWQKACGGGCPLLNGTDLHQRYCRIYRCLLPDLLRLEGQRLVASGKQPVAS